MNPLETIVEALDSLFMAVLGIHFSFGNAIVLGAFFGFGWLFGKLTRRVGIIKAFFALIVGAYFYTFLKDAHFVIVWAFLLGVLANHSYLYWGVLSWARNLSDIVFAMRYRSAFEDIRRREEELAERERQFQAQARAQARSQGESAQQRQWKEQAQARRSGQNQTGSGNAGAKNEQASGRQSSQSTGSPTKEGLRTHYLRVLGLDPFKEYSESEIKRAYRKRAKETHPDTGGSSAAFQDVNGAYEWLLNS